MSRVPILAVLLLGAMATQCASTATSPPQQPVQSPAPVTNPPARDEQCAEVSDRLYFGPVGRVIIGKFETLEKLSQTLRLDAVVAQHEGRTWRLHDILVTAHFSGNGYVASWIISAPEPVLTAYVDRLEKGYRDRSLLYDFAAEPYCIQPGFD